MKKTFKELPYKDLKKIKQIYVIFRNFKYFVRKIHAKRPIPGFCHRLRYLDQFMVLINSTLNYLRVGYIGRPLSHVTGTWERGVQLLGAGLPPSSWRPDCTSWRPWPGMIWGCRSPRWRWGGGSSGGGSGSRRLRLPK